jgi:hypothetical protein
MLYIKIIELLVARCYTFSRYSSKHLEFGDKSRVTNSDHDDWGNVKQRYKLLDRDYFDGISNKSEGTVRSSHVN